MMMTRAIRVCPLQFFGLFDIVWSSVLLSPCTVDLKTQAAQSMPFALKIHWLVRSIVEEWLGFHIFRVRSSEWHIVCPIFSSFQS